MLSNLKSKLQQKGVLFDEENNTISLPKIIISIENMHNFNAKEADLVKQLRPKRVSKFIKYMGFTSSPTTNES